MTFARFAQRIDGLNYLAEQMELSGSRVRRYLMQIPFCDKAEVLEKHFDILQKAYEIHSLPENEPALMQLRHLFTTVHDIKGTLEALKQKQVLDEIELFELKYFASLCRDFRLLCKRIDFMSQAPMCLQHVFDWLDPDKTGTSGFYMYDSYSPSLAQARKAVLATDPEKEPESWNRATDLVQQEEWSVRKTLSEELSKRYEVLQNNFDQLARLEIWLAKAALAVKYGMVRPQVAPVLSIEGMVNPMIADILVKSKGTFQPVSVTLHQGPCLLTGANMSGKTVVLKTLALIQALTQFSFFVPARTAQIPLVKDVFLVVGDKQDYYKGLSSFAAEMLALDRIMDKIKKGNRFFVLVDEPARTTNPYEGTAILCALLAFMEQYRVMSLISTHYGELNTAVRKLRVVGFEGEKAVGRIDPTSINQYMNYSLVEDKRTSVPKEALQIARLLGVDDSFIKRAQEFLKKNNHE
ncbi:MAG: hypothetical protein GX877_02605 [Bacteroidales bacterium]|nr:hypothetical protein [Bacteroidales bacterium]